MLLFKRIVVVCLALILSIAPARAVLAPESIPAVFDELLKVPALSNPAMIIIDGTTGQIIYEKNIHSQRKPASVWISSDHNVARKMKRVSLPYIGFNTLSGIKKANGGSLKNYKVVYSNLYSQDVANLKAFWAKRGFKPNFKSVSDEVTLLSQGELIASENSPTVAVILDWMMLWSDNTLADRLARLSARAAGYSFDFKGVDTVFRELLTRFEIDHSKLVVEDASGLSKKNKITAKLMGEFLYKIHKDEKYALLYDSLPISGVSGTLQNRFIKTAPSAVGLVRAKTGTLNGTATLAGYVESTDREYVFVALADEIPLGNSALDKARAAIDRVLGRIAAPNIPAEISPVP
ncbi:MAG: D-alanyl-D-alanine carboxypeptidase [Streptomycetaceae bacterium]|nr:D-alanyl-D-alanine carboxypeptidase [Streptomycetaceae bacterium]